MEQKRLLSLFDYSGTWSQPFFDGGWDVIQWDIKLDEFMDINLIEDGTEALEMFHDVDGVIAAVPCTDFTNSGSHAWTRKDQDGSTEESMELVRQTLRLVDLFTPTDPDYDGTFFWAIENPVGRLPRLFPELPKAYWFNPYEFALWNDITPEDIAWLDKIRLKDGIGVTDREAEHIVKCNAYTKKTGLFGDFSKELIRKPLLPVKASPQGSFTQRYGGSSEKTKEARSITPTGFSKAFYEANKHGGLKWSERMKRKHGVQLKISNLWNAPSTGNGSIMKNSANITC